MTQRDVQTLVEKATRRTAYANAAGISVVSVEPGVAVLALDRRPDLLQFNGYFHGGVVCGLIDHSAGGAVTSALPEGKLGVTIDLHVNFLAPADGERLVATAKATQTGQTVSVVQVQVMSSKGGQDRLCAIGTVTLRTVDMPPLLKG